MSEASKSETDWTSMPEGAYGDFASNMSYGDYLKLDDLLKQQTPLSKEHDEMLFVVIHHVSELWMKLALHELYAARDCVTSGELDTSFKMMSRVVRIQHQLVNAWEVLSTMTPADYLKFRDSLGQSSGFQSYQYRELEFLLGNKKPGLMKPFAHQPEIYNKLKGLLDGPSIYDGVIALLAQRGFRISDKALSRDFSQPYMVDESVLEAWETVYRNTDEHWDLYELAEKLVDLEDAFQQWRFRHLRTVTRIIGFKRGTGGTVGVNYLQKALDYTFFPELWNVRTRL